MVKVFSFMVAVGALISSVNAALLVSYEYPNAGDKGYTTVGPAANASESEGSFSAIGSVASATMGTSGATQNRLESFFVTGVGNSFLTISSITFDGVKQSGSRSVTFAAAFNLGTAVGDGVFSSPPSTGFLSGSTLTGVLTTSGNTYTYTFATPILVSSSQILRTMITATGTGAGGQSTVVTLDNVKFFGGAVPEPSSIAVFGLLGAGAVIRRIRRKS